MTRPFVPARRMSTRGLKFLIREEGSFHWVYNDRPDDPAKGNATFGVGHLVHLGPPTAADRHKWGTPEHPHSEKFVRSVLRADLVKYEAAVRSLGVRLRQREFDALVSLAFNIGIAAFKASTVARELRQGRAGSHLRKAADAILRWDVPSILRPRRVRERALFLHGTY